MQPKLVIPIFGNLGDPYPPGENKILTVLPSPLFLDFSTNHLEDSRMLTNHYTENLSRDYVKNT